MYVCMYLIPGLENRDTCIQALRDQISEIDKHLSPFKSILKELSFLSFTDFLQTVLYNFPGYY